MIGGLGSFSLWASSAGVMDATGRVSAWQVITNGSNRAASNVREEKSKLWIMVVSSNVKKGAALFCASRLTAGSGRTVMLLDWSANNTFIMLFHDVLKFITDGRRRFAI